MKKHTVIIAEDHTILRDGLKFLLNSEADMDVVGEAEDGIVAIRLARKLLPDIILMDLSMPKMSGLGAIKEIKKFSPDSKILVLTIHNTDEYIMEVLNAGADGYILKDANQEELIMAIRSVLSGGSYLSPGVSKKVIDGYLEGKKELKVVTAWDSLTQREKDVLKMIAEGYKNKEIADNLCISVKTVEKHRANLMKKLDLHNASAVTAFALEKGLINQ